jgi:hypothetical protein
MKPTAILLFLGVLAVPVWYAYRTLTEARVRRLIWSEVFMTEGERQQKWADERRKAQEAAEAERLAKATELERATTERKQAEAEATKAQMEARERKTQEEAAAEDRRLVVERRSAEIAAIRVKSEAESSSRRRSLTSRNQYCRDWEKKAEQSVQSLVQEQKAYRAFTDEVLRMPFPPTTPLYESEFTQTFRMLYMKTALEEVRETEIQDKFHKCEKVASDPARLDGDIDADSQARELMDLARGYSSSVANLRSSGAQIKDLVDYMNRNLGDSVGGEIRAARVKDMISRSRNWKESQ